MSANVVSISVLRRVQELLERRATGTIDQAENQEFALLRPRLIADARLKHVMPQWLRTCRSLDLFWPYIKERSGTYVDRRRIINEELNPLFELLEGSALSPSDHISGIKLEAFDKAGVHDIWLRALDRRSSDPDGAITLARTLIESTLKKFLMSIQWLMKMALTSLSSGGLLRMY
jgi:hypothetical protein